MMRLLLLLACLAVLLQGQPQRATPVETVYVLKPAFVFDGESAQLHANWAVLVRGQKIVQVGPAGGINASGAKTIDLPGLTLLPGLIEAHSHVLLHPYSETIDRKSTRLNSSH